MTRITGILPKFRRLNHFVNQNGVLEVTSEAKSTPFKFKYVIRVKSLKIR